MYNLPDALNEGNSMPEQQQHQNEREPRPSDQLFMKYTKAWTQMTPGTYYPTQLSSDSWPVHDQPGLLGSQAREFKVDLKGNPNTDVALIFWAEGGRDTTRGLGDNDQRQKFSIVVSQPDTDGPDLRVDESGDPIIAATYSFLVDGTIAKEQETARRVPAKQVLEGIGVPEHLDSFDRHPDETTADDMLVLGELLAKINVGDIRNIDPNAGGALAWSGPYGEDGWYPEVD